MRHIAALGYLIASVFAYPFAMFTVLGAVSAFSSPQAPLMERALMCLLGLAGLSLFVSFLLGAVACYLSGRKRSFLMAFPWLCTIFVALAFGGVQDLIVSMSPHHPQLDPPPLTTR